MRRGERSVPFYYCKEEMVVVLESKYVVKI